MFAANNHVDEMLKSTNDMLYENGLQNTLDINGHMLQDKKGRHKYLFTSFIEDSF